MFVVNHKMYNGLTETFGPFPSEETAERWKDIAIKNSDKNLLSEENWYVNKVEPVLYF